MGRGSFARGISRDALKAAGYEVKSTRSASPNAGKAAEDALYGWLDILGIAYLPQYRWGAELEPPRRYVSDAAIPAARLLIEVNGRAHIAGFEKYLTDMRRTRAAYRAGWVILPFSPDEAKDGTASLEIQALLEGRP